MSQSRSLLGDGSAEADAHDIVEIDRSKPHEKWRWLCPNGHSDWDRTNNHIWCRTCRQQHEHGADMDPEHYHLLDKKEHRLIPWTRVRVL